MHATRAARTSILYQDPHAAITLIDIPTSIALSQGGTHGDTVGDRVLRSSEPPTTPFVIANEPKSAAARSKALGNTADVAFHAAIRALVTNALNEIQVHHHQDWCLPRPCVASDNPRAGKKRKAEGHDGLGIDRASQETHTSSFNHEPSVPSNSDQSCTRPEILNMTSLAEYSTSQVHKRVISNLSSESCQLTILPLGSDASVPHETYVIPPKATFLLANVQESAIFEDGVRHLMSSTPSTAGSEPFDLILLDPPWPNASAKRAKTYGRPRSTADIHHLLLSLPLRAHIAAAGLVGVWITNKIRFRSLVLGDQDGASECRSLFNAWGLELVEEWIWIKVTKRGEPITDLESAWRKPYEMLLLGRRTARALHGSSGDDDRHKIKRRIIAGVPDIHSRKPSLRELLAPLMPRPEYRALEIFARNLTQGWWAWGDEVLKFNEVGWWSGGRTEGTSD